FGHDPDTVPRCRRFGPQGLALSPVGGGGMGSGRSLCAERLKGSNGLGELGEVVGVCRPGFRAHGLEYPYRRF
ncbi:MAG: hypothetical protein ABIJ53_01005, partial [Verrucomicrobiota bacterium]